MQVRVVRIKLEFSPVFKKGKPEEAANDLWQKIFHLKT